jgi:hypothetical protein
MILTKITPISNKIYKGPPIRAILKTSGVGVITAAEMAIRRIAYLRFRVKNAALTTLRVLNKARMSGSSNVNPNPKIKKEQKDTYFPAEIIGLIWAD